MGYAAALSSVGLIENIVECKASLGALGPVGWTRLIENIVECKDARPFLNTVQKSD